MRRAANDTSVRSPDLNLRLLRHLVRYLTDHYSAREVETVGAAAGMSVAELMSGTGWVSLEQFEALLASARALMPTDAVFMEACTYKLHEVSGPIRILRLVASPIAAYLAGAKRMVLISQISVFEPEVISRNRVRIGYRTTKKESRLMCLSRQAQIRALPTLWDLPPALVGETCCVARGDDHCSYDVRLYETRRWAPLAIATGGAAALGVFLQVVMSAPVVWWWFALAAALLAHLSELRRSSANNHKTQAEINEAYLEMAREEAAARRELFAVTQRQKISGAPGEAFVRTARLLGRVPAHGPWERFARRKGAPVQSSPRPSPARSGPRPRRRRPSNQSPREARKPNSDAEATDSRIGTVIADKYRIIRLIGAGGMGRVYEARDVNASGRVAVKFIAAKYASEPRMLQRFEREARIAGGLEHPSIAAVIDFGLTADNVRYLIFEYLEGETCEKVLAREGALSVPRALNIIDQVCDGLAVAHEAGIVHRDLKPANLFICARKGDDQTESAKILDFGIAKQFEGSEDDALRTDTGACVGTPQYMSPEQARGATDVDHRSDIYALGAMLYELLSGRKAHGEGSPLEVVYSILHRPRTPLLKLRPELPPTLVAAVEKAMARDPVQRFQSVLELKAALQQSSKKAGASERTEARR